MLCFASGGVLWFYGRERYAVTAWLVGLGLTGFFGIISVGWETLEYLTEQREGHDDTSADSERNELAPNISLSRDTKISFLITVVVLLVLGTVTYVLSSLQ